MTIRERIAHAEARALMLEVHKAPRWAVRKVEAEIETLKAEQRHRRALLAYSKRKGEGA